MLLSPQPLLHITELDGPGGWWEAKDDDCALRLLPHSAGLPNGWTCITVSLQAPRYDQVMPRFQADSGHGYRPLAVLPLHVNSARCIVLIHVPPDARALTLHLRQILGPFRLHPIKAQPLSRPAAAAALALVLGVRWLHSPPLMLKVARQLAKSWRSGGRAEFRSEVRSTVMQGATFRRRTDHADSSGEWTARSERLFAASLPDVACRFSLLVPVTTRNSKQLDIMFAALAAQINSNWECLLGLAPEVALPRHESDARVSCLTLPTADRGAMLATLAAAATGDMLLVLDPGDQLTPAALAALAGYPDASIVYGDEDTLNSNGCYDAPCLKPGWSPDLLHAFNYFGRPTALRRHWIDQVGGFDAMAGEAAEWDLHLRLAAVAAPIERVPRILCHRCGDPDQDHLRGLHLQPPEDRAGQGRAVIGRYWGHLGFEVQVTTQPDGSQRSICSLKSSPLVSIILLSSDDAATLEACILGIEERTNYPHTQIIIVDRGSTDPAAAMLYGRLVSQLRAQVIVPPLASNNSAARNAGARVARGDLLLFLDNDVQVTTSDWLQELVQFALRPEVGVVGTLVTGADGTVRHAGITIGMDLFGALFRGRAASDWGPAAVPRTLSAVAWTCMMVRQEVFMRVGGFDESYPRVNGDTAFCLAARASGWRIVYTPFARLVQQASTAPDYPVTAEDLVRIGIDVRRFGFQQDPFFRSAIAAEGINPGQPQSSKTGISLLEAVRAFGLGRDRSVPLDLNNDADVAEAVAIPVTAVIWKPQPAALIQDQWSAARWCLDLLRRRPDLRQQFPNALSAGADGAFAVWLTTKGAAQFKLSAQATTYIRSTFTANLAHPARQAILTETKLAGPMAVGFLPIGRTVLLKFLLQKGRTYPRLEEIWWLALECSEDPARELVLSYRFNPGWQALFPDGLTIFGQRRLAAWFAAVYQCDASWTDPAVWPTGLSAADQIRVAWQSNQQWQARHPDALATRDSARALLDWLTVLSEDGSGSDLSTQVRNWLSTLPLATTADAIAAPGVNVIGHLCYPSGLRTSAFSIVKGLQAAGHGITLRDVPVEVPHDLPEHVLFDGLEMYDTTLLHIQPEPLFAVAYDFAGLHPRRHLTYRIGYWYWELETIPKTWSAAVANVDEVWAATRFVADAMRACCTVPVCELMPGVELPEFTKRPVAAFGIASGHFTFLFVFHMMSIMERKNPLGLIRAFQQAFSAREPVTLVLKTSFGDRHPLLMRQLHEAASQSGGRVTVIDQIFSADETISLMEACDAYISLHRSEGLGLTMAEAMLLGKPVIATGYSGNLSFMNRTNSLLVDYRLVTVGADTPVYGSGSSWAEPSEAHAARLMRQVWENRQAAADMGARARTDLETHLSVSAAGLRMADRLAAIRHHRLQARPK